MATRWATSWTSLAARPGVKWARTRSPGATSAHVAGWRPERRTERVVQSSSKSAVNPAATTGSSSRTITFSSRLQLSFVQLVEPVQTEAPSTTMYLWCMRSGDPGTASLGTSSDRRNSWSTKPGGGSGRVLARSWL